MTCGWPWWEASHARVVVLTRDEVLDVRANLTVAEVTTQARGLVVEVPIGPDAGGERDSVVNCDGVHTIAQRRLTRHWEPSPTRNRTTSASPYR